MNHQQELLPKPPPPAVTDPGCCESPENGARQFKEQADAWMQVWNILKAHNPEFQYTHTQGLECALREIMRLQELDVPENKHGRK